MTSVAFSTLGHKIFFSPSFKNDTYFAAIFRYFLENHSLKDITPISFLIVVMGPFLTESSEPITMGTLLQNA